MSGSPQPAAFFVVGGPVNRNAPSYVARQADEDLYQGLQRGNFCYVLTSRQMGKSSLKGSVAARLRQEGAHVAQLDLTGLGQNLSVEQWYLGLLFQLGRELDLEDQLDEFWDQHDELGSMQRWMRALREVVLERLPGRCVIFIDEIDATRSLPFSTDEFFAGIRELYHRRTADAELNRLTFCLLGVATPSDLIQDVRTTPFNIGYRVELNDFSEQEAGVFLEGLRRPMRLGRRLLRRILYWTGGQPYLTQRLCQAVADDTRVLSPAGVDRLCEDLFLSQSARERDDNLLFVRNRILRSDEDAQVKSNGGVPGVLGIYSKVRKATGSHLPLERLYERVKDDAAQPLLNVLRLSGITRVREGFLYVRNRIYYRVFDRAWIESSLPLDESRRQRAARRDGQLRVLRIALPLILLFFFLAVAAWMGWSRASRNAQAAASERSEVREQEARNEIQEAQNVKQAGELKTRNAEAERSDRAARAAVARAGIATAKAKTEEEMAGKESQRADSVVDAALDYSTTAVSQIWQRYESAPPPTATSSDAQSAGNQPDAQSAGDPPSVRQRDQMLQAYSDVLESSVNLAEGILKSDPRNQKATNLKAIDLFLDCDSLRRQHLAAKAKDACEASVKWAAAIAADTSPNFQVISAYAYAGTAVAMSWMGESVEGLKAAERGVQIADALPSSLKKEQDSAWNWQKLAQAYGYVGSVEERENHVEEALHAYNQQLQMDNELYRTARTQGYPDTAVATLGEAVKTNDKIGALQMKRPERDFPAMAEAYKNAVRIGEVRVQVTKTPNLKKSAKQIRDAQSDLVADYLMLARAEQELNQIQEARDSYTHRIQILLDLPDKTTADQGLLAYAYKRLGDFELVYGSKQAALDAYQKRLPLARQLAANQPDFSAQLNLSETYQQIGDAEAALRNEVESRKAYTLALEGANTYLKMADNAARKKIDADAEDHLMRGYEQKADAESALGARDQARADLNESLKAARQRLALARNELDKDNNDSAKKADLVSYYGGLAWIELLNGDPQDAIADAASGLKMDPDQDWIKGNLAHAYLLTGKIEEAKAAYKASKGCEVNSETFEEAVFEDFVVLKQLGWGSPAMDEIEKLLGVGANEPSSIAVVGAAQR